MIFVNEQTVGLGLYLTPLLRAGYQKLRTFSNVRNIFSGGRGGILPFKESAIASFVLKMCGHENGRLLREVSLLNLRIRTRYVLGVSRHRRRPWQ